MRAREARYDNEWKRKVSAHSKGDRLLERTAVTKGPNTWTNEKAKLKVVKRRTNKMRRRDGNAYMLCCLITKPVGTYVVQ